MPIGSYYVQEEHQNSTRKNYKIEALEPRLMMDASADGWNQELYIASTSFSSDLTTVASAEWKRTALRRKRLPLRLGYENR